MSSFYFPMIRKITTVSVLVVLTAVALCRDSLDENRIDMLAFVETRENTEFGVHSIEVFEVDVNLGGILRVETSKKVLGTRFSETCDFTRQEVYRISSRPFHQLIEEISGIESWDESILRTSPGKGARFVMRASHLPGGRVEWDCGKITGEREKSVLAFLDLVGSIRQTSRSVSIEETLLKTEGDLVEPRVISIWEAVAGESTLLGKRVSVAGTLRHRSGWVLVPAEPESDSLELQIGRVSSIVGKSILDVLEDGHAARIDGVLEDRGITRVTAIKLETSPEKSH